MKIVIQGDTDKMNNAMAAAIYEGLAEWGFPLADFSISGESPKGAKAIARRLTEKLESPIEVHVKGEDKVDNSKINLGNYLEYSDTDDAPIVKGTIVTVNQVISRILEGWEWRDILRHYPEITEADIRACIKYTLSQDEYLATNAKLNHVTI